MTISRICSPALRKGWNTKVCMWGDVPDVITPIKFDVDRFRGFDPSGSKKSGCSTDKASRPYNSAALQCRLWLLVSSCALVIQQRIDSDCWCHQVIQCGWMVLKESWRSYSDSTQPLSLQLLSPVKPSDWLMLLTYWYFVTE